jgi:hypothetical protein
MIMDPVCDCKKCALILAFTTIVLKVGITSVGHRRRLLTETRFGDAWRIEHTRSGLRQQAFVTGVTPKIRRDHVGGRWRPELLA